LPIGKGIKISFQAREFYQGEVGEDREGVVSESSPAAPALHHLFFYFLKAGNFLLRPFVGQF
jgi:hypothetical protein